MLVPTSRHRCWNVAVEPVKWMPASRGSASTTSETAKPSPVTRLITPGRQAGGLEQLHGQVRRRTSAWQTASTPRCCPSAPGAVGRLPAMAVKLNGVIA